MPLTLRNGEAILWESRAAPLFMEDWAMRGAFLLAYFLIAMSWWSSGGFLFFETISVVAFVLTVIVLTAIILDYVSLRNAHYYITNQRVGCEKGAVSMKTREISLQHLSYVDLFFKRQLNRTRDVANVDFHSRDSRKLTFARVREPAKVKQIALEAKNSLAP